MNARILTRSVFLMMTMLLPASGWAEVVDIPPNQLTSYLQSHSEVVVLFTSPDRGCDYCIGAEGPFRIVSRKVGASVSFVRVQWAPWLKLPPEIRALGVNGIPSQFAYIHAKRVDILPGKIKDPDIYAKKLDGIFLTQPH